MIWLAVIFKIVLITVAVVFVLAAPLCANMLSSKISRSEEGDDEEPEHPPVHHLRVVR